MLPLTSYVSTSLIDCKYCEENYEFGISAKVAREITDTKNAMVQTVLNNLKDNILRHAERGEYQLRIAAISGHDTEIRKHMSIALYVLELHGFKIDVPVEYRCLEVPIFESSEMELVISWDNNPRTLT